MAMSFMSRWRRVRSLMRVDSSVRGVRAWGRSAAMFCHNRAAPRPNLIPRAPSIGASHSDMDARWSTPMSERTPRLMNWLALLVLLALGIVWPPAFALAL
jgi:hypothetical protein